MKAVIITLVALLYATPAAAQDPILYPELQDTVVKAVESAKVAASHLTKAENRQVFKMSRPVCSDAKDLGTGYTDKVADRLDLAFWAKIMLFNVCLVKNYGTPDQFSAILAMMR